MLVAARHSAYSENRVGSYYRARYYDANAGRFVSEDPVRFGGGLNLYQYVDGNPVLFVDARGLWKNTHEPADPNLNTIVCDGHGGIRPQIGGPGTPQQKECYGDCMLLHEESHRRDALKSNPKVCKGAADGIQIGYSNAQEQSASEIAASKVDIDCMKKKLKGACDTCKPLLDDRIKQLESFRDSFKK